MMARGRLSRRALNRATLARQMLLERAPLPVPDAVRRLAAVQAQHPGWPRVALWSRLVDHTPRDLSEALVGRDVVRATLMRLTLHVVHAADFWPMMAIALPARQNQFRLWYHEHPTDRTIMRRLEPAHGAALAALADGPCSLAKLRELMAAALPREAAREPRYLWRHFAATVPLVDVPPPEGEATYGRSWYALAADWLRPPTADPDERSRALGLLAERYLAAHGPASRADFVAWTGRLSATDARAAMAALGERLVTLSDENGRELLDIDDAPRPDEDVVAGVRFLARWDSLLLGYQTKQRDRFLPRELHEAVNRPNADVLPTFLVDGFVAGTWRYENATPRRPGRIRLAPLRRLAPAERRALTAEASAMAHFLALGEDAEVSFGAG